MEIPSDRLIRPLARSLAALLPLAVAAACGTVTAAGGDDDGDGGGEHADGGPGDRDPDGGGGSASRFVRVLHTVPEEGATRLYAADVIDGAIQPARLLSGETPGGIVDRVQASDDGQTVVYRSDAESAGEPDLYLVRFEGDQPGAPVRLSDDHGASYVVQSFLEADGSGAIYGAGTVGGGFVSIEDYYAVDLSGPAPGAPVPLGHGSFVYGGVLAEDGSTFAFLEDGAAYVVALDGAAPPEPVRVGPAAGDAQNVVALALAPDGSAIALVGDLTTDGVNELYVADVSGASPGPVRRANRTLVAGGDVYVGPLGLVSHYFSPDGGQLAYFADARIDGVTELFVVEVSGGTPGSSERVNGDPVAGGAVLPGYTSPFSPDGRLIAYRADQLSDGVTELFVADLTSGAPAAARRVNGVLAAGGDVSSYRFAPDGSGLVYQADQRSDEVTELYYADTRGSQPGPPQRVNRDPVSGGDVSSPVAFARDGGSLACAGDLMVDERAELFLAAIADGTVEPAERAQASSAATSGIYSIEFAPDGSLVYAGDTARAACDLWIAEPGGGEAQRVNITTARDSGVIGFWLRPR